MPDREVVEKSAESEFAFLLPLGFSEPIVERNSWGTSVDWLQGSIALELELDFRELEVSCLVVRLKNGKLPDGYYVAEGRRCRMHLLRVIKDRKWLGAKGYIDELLATRKTGGPRNMDTMRDRIKSYKLILTAVLPQLLAEKSDLFAEAGSDIAGMASG
jgi:hypothetical protein